MARLWQVPTIFAANLLVSAGVILFIIGFFRGQTGKPILTEADATMTGYASLDPAPFDKIIFMMIDALRSDFVYEENTGFRFTKSLIHRGAAIPFTARAASPTLTLSRIKALTQGTSQSFLDVWLNVFESESARSLKGADTWLSRLKTEKHTDKKMVFYGADLWLDLYPDIFDRYEATDAWYLPEFITVDSNITRHLPEELQNDDWKALVLHYLGLDNIAHQAKPFGTLMLSKQAEMDSIVQQIYEAIEHQAHLKNTLFILLGDHGMTEQGNHGGGSPGEVASAMVFISPHFKHSSKRLESPVNVTSNYEYYTVVNQVDLVPTLARLLGFSIPVRSIGIMIPEILDLIWNDTSRPQSLFENAQQIKSLFDTENRVTVVDGSSCNRHCEGCVQDDAQLICLWENAREARLKYDATQNSGIEEMYQATRTFCDHAQKLLNVPPNSPSFPEVSLSIACILFSISLLLTVLWPSEAPLIGGLWAFMTIVGFHALTMFINPLVEEEHHYWYLTSLVWLGSLGFKRMIDGEHWFYSVAYPLVLQLFSQSLHETGDPGRLNVEYIQNNLSRYPVLFWIPTVITYISAIDTVSKYLGLGSIFSLMATGTLCLTAIVFRLSSSYRVNPELLNFAPLWFERLIKSVDGDFTLNIFWTGLVACLILLPLQLKVSNRISGKTMLGGMVELTNLYLRSLTRPEYLVLFSIFDLQLKWLMSAGAGLSPSIISVTSLLLGQSAFFASGHNNSFAAFDLTQGFNGIKTPRTIVVAVQVLLSNFLGPVWWALASLRLLQSCLEGDQDSSAAIQLHKHVDNTEAAVDGAPQKNGTPHQNKMKEHKLNGNITAIPNPSKADSLGISSKVNNIGFPRQHCQYFLQHLTLQTLYTAVSSLSVILACIWKRNDPRVWTVLAPKCLNMILWACFQQSLIHFVLCAGMWAFVV